MSFPRYENYKDSGVEWLGDIPFKWEVLPLKYVAGLLTEKTDRREFPVALENIEGWSGRFIPSDTEFEGEGVGFAAGDILFGKLRPYLAKVWVADQLGEAVGDFHVLHPNPGVDPRFLQYLMLNRDFISIVDGSTFGAKMPRANWDFMGMMRIPFPSISEQRAIAAFLDRETGKIDALVAEQEKLIGLLKEKRQAVISHAVTKGLDPNARMKDSGIEWLGEVPAAWKIVPFSFGINFQEGPGILAVDFHDDGIPLLRVAGVQGRWATLDGCNFLDPEKVEKRWAHFRLDSGDLLISASASMGTVCEVGPETAGAIPYTGLIRLNGRDGVVTKDFVRAIVVSALFSTQIDLLKAGATIQHFGPSHLGQMKIVLPPIEEQQQIADYISLQHQAFDALIEEAQKAIELMKERRTALISAAVTGKVDVRGYEAVQV